MLIADLHVLLVEDHAFQRAVLLKLLGTLGLRDVETAADGGAALALLQTSPGGFDVIITDMDMPGMDGMEFLRHVGQAAWPLSVVVASAAQDSVLASIERMGLAYGVHVIGVLRKPVTLESLGQVLRRHEDTTARVVAASAPCHVHALDEVLHGLRHGQFEPHFQPKVELATGRLRGLEALARWRRPGERILAPAAFLPALEAEPAHMEELTWQMLLKSAIACAGWRASGLETCVSVNLHARELGDVEFVPRLLAMVRDHGLRPWNLMIEITESGTLQRDCGAAMENVARLHMRGFGLSCDDFGTGYATMEQLARIPFTELKIDQGFVRNAHDGDTALIILRSALQMAHRLKMVSVGEGVQTQQEWDLLLELGCELAQGHFIAPAMQAANVVRWSRQRDSSWSELTAA